MSDPTIIVIEEQPAEIISEGIQGPPGPVMNTIGGFEIAVSSPAPGDLFGIGVDNKWTNIPKTQITDGGNF